MYVYMYLCVYMYMVYMYMLYMYPFLVNRLWEEGWKDRYYETKFDVACDDIDFVRQVVESYMEGLCWVMAYYYQVSTH